MKRLAFLAALFALILAAVGFPAGPAPARAGGSGDTTYYRCNAGNPGKIRVHHRAENGATPWTDAYHHGTLMHTVDSLQSVNTICTESAPFGTPNYGGSFTSASGSGIVRNVECNGPYDLLKIRVDEDDDGSGIDALYMTGNLQVLASDTRGTVTYEDGSSKSNQIVWSTSYCGLI